MSKLVSLILAGLLLIATAFSAAGCGEESPVSTTSVETSPSVTTSETVTITDASGREITLDLPLERVIYFHPSIAEGLVIVNAWDRVIAKDGFTIDSVIFPNLDTMPLLATTESGTIDYEAIIELQPDALLVLPAAIDIEESITRLEPEIPVISVFDLSDADTFTKGIELLGTIMQQEDEALEFVDFCQGIEDNISSRTADLDESEKPRVFMSATGWTADQFCTYTNEFAFYGKLMELTGAVNIAADLPSIGGWVQVVDVEWLMTQKYDCIMLQIWDSFYPGVMGFNVQDAAAAKALYEEMLQLTAFFGSQAVANGNLYLVENGMLSSASYYILMEYSAKVFHPKLFADLDPKVTHQEYLTRFMRIDIDMDNSGVFFYPEN